jgi:CubicO group peptidase (beta-lactamase class C family)
MKTQFRVLYRQFLFRMVDLELLSASAQGDMSKLFGQFAALFLFIGMILAWIGATLLQHDMPPETRLILCWSSEHFLIATTMLVVGLFAVLSWDSTFPDRRDVLVLAPLPVPARTLFLAKVAAVGTALVIPIVALHVLPCLSWPFGFNWATPAQAAPTLSWDPAMKPLDLSELQPVLTRDLDSVLRVGPLAPDTGGGVSIGVLKHGVRRVFAYGTAEPDSIFEIGSISKTFTGLLLARAVLDGRVRLDQPVRELLPPGTVAKPEAEEVTLLDLITHHSGIPSIPFNLRPGDESDPRGKYSIADFYSFINDWGVRRPNHPHFEYSNAGVALVALALANATGSSFAEIVQRQITLPLGLGDTAVHPSPDQRRRVIQGYTARHEPAGGWNLDALAGAGGVRSSAGDMLTYLEANLDADRLPTADSLTKALRYSHQLRAQADFGMDVALGWFHVAKTGAYWHNGATQGYTAFAFFNPRTGLAAVVLFNNRLSASDLPDTLGEHIRARLAGEPALSLRVTSVPPVGGALHALRLFAVYWTVMFAAGAFIYCSVLAIQGLAAQLLPRPLFLRVSSLLQLVAFCLLVSVYFLQPLITTPGELFLDQNRALAAWSPSYWFLGLFQQLSGSPALPELADRAWAGLVTALLATSVAYTLSYFRTLRRIAEEPDIVPVRRRGLAVPRFGDNVSTAIGQFSVRTLLRSRQHRMLLAFFLGIAFAFTIFFVRSPGTHEFASTSAVPLLGASIIVVLLWIVGARIVFSMPMDLRANWIFRVAPLGGGPRLQNARRRALIAGSLIPALLLSAVLLFSLLSPTLAAEHVTILALVGLILCELCLAGKQKIPFTCSYLPGKSNFNMTFALICSWLLFLPIGKSAQMEQELLEKPGPFATLFVALAALALLARWRTRRLAKTNEGEPDFEETAEPAIFSLELHRDGITSLDLKS